MYACTYLLNANYSTQLHSRHKCTHILSPGYSRSVEMRKGCTTTFRGLWTLGWTAFCANRSTADVGLAVVWVGFCREGERYIHNGVNNIILYKGYMDNEVEQPKQRGQNTTSQTCTACTVLAVVPI